VVGWKIINIADEVGFNGWSSQIVNMTTDYMDYNEESKRCNISVFASSVPPSVTVCFTKMWDMGRQKM
jgi:recombination DNA repair RAD52 pathway protein